jgi:O-methyltransferase
MLRLQKRLTSWWRERQLSATSRAVRRERLTYLSPAKLERLEEAMTTIEREKVPGDILEFGLALGGSGIVLARNATNGRRFHGFDVFAMIPPPTSDNDDSKSKERYEKIAGGEAKGIGGDPYYGYRPDLFEHVQETFAKYGSPVNGSNVQLHKGLFEETWPKTDIRQVAFAHIDCDWYDPVKYCLESVAAKLSPGGIILIDDYHDYGGSRVAVDEFVANHPDYGFSDGPNPILRKARQPARAVA